MLGPDSSLTTLLLAALQPRLAQHSGPFLIALDGPSGAGKSTLAARLA